MLKWLGRWWTAERPAAPAAAVLPARQAAVASAASAAASVARLSPFEPLPGGAGQRRPLIGAGGAVAGFELRFADVVLRRLAGQWDGPAAGAYAAALLAAAAELRQAGREALLVWPSALLAREPLVAQAPAGVLLLPQGDAPDPACARAWRARDVRLGVADGAPGQAAHADFLLLRAQVGGIDTVLLAAQRWQRARPRLPIVVLGLDGVDELERVLAAGIGLAGGRFDRGKRPGAAAPRRTLDAAAHRICGLLNELALDHDSARLAAALRADVALSYRLLRYANSPLVGASREIDSVEAALLLLGRAELGRWLAVMLLTAGSARPASAAVQEDALARGRLFETLALRQGQQYPERLFTLGLLSRLDLLLQMPLAQALEPLRLGEAARLALLERKGPWAVWLALAEALEGEDEDLLARLCEGLGGVETVLEEARRAWDWAARIGLK